MEIRRKRKATLAGKHTEGEWVKKDFPGRGTVIRGQAGLLNPRGGGT